MLRMALLLACLMPAAGLAQDVPEPAGYRDAPYGAPVPPSLSGATTVDTEEAHDLWEQGRVLFIDVFPRDVRPENLPEGTIWRDRPRDSIPRAVWLPNVGYSVLPPNDAAYFELALSTLTDGNLMHPVLFFCRQDCWMSWNAAKRALALGYLQVHWYPGGTDGWISAGYTTELASPLELP